MGKKILMNRTISYYAGAHYSNYASKLITGLLFLFYAYI